MRLPEIGSDFWIDPGEDLTPSGGISLEQYRLGGSDRVLLSTGRSAIALVLEERDRPAAGRSRKALVPPYTCESVLQPFLERGYELQAYPVSEELQTTPAELEEAIGKARPDVVLVHGYFGFDSLKGCGTVIRSHAGEGITFVEDVTQTLFSGHVRLPADHYVGSLRKWAGMPDGGFAVRRTGFFSYRPEVCDETLSRMKLAACYAKYEYLYHGRGDKQAFLDMYAAAEEHLDAADRCYRISPASEAILARLDAKRLSDRRRENYRVLFEELKDVPGLHSVTGEPDPDTVPLYFPMYVEDRRALQLKLREERIYAPVIWPRPEHLPAICREADDLYEHILCIPIDQRYDAQDMERVIGVIKKGS